MTPITQYFSAAQSFDVTCPDGQVKTTLLAAGSYVSIICQADADMRAQAICRKRALERTLCTNAAGALPVAIRNYSYYYLFTCTGGFYPHTFSLKIGPLPPGLNLLGNGQLIGTPVTSGSYYFVVRVTDSDEPANVIETPYTIDVID